MHSRFKKFLKCAEEGAKYDGEGKNWRRKKPWWIFQSLITQIIADTIEDGWPECQDVEITNKNLLEKGENFIARNKLRHIVARMKPVVSSAEKAKQGSLGPRSPWPKARNFWALQMLVRFVTTQVERPLPRRNHAKATPSSLD